MITCFGNGNLRCFPPLLSGSNPGGVVRFLSAAPNAGSLAMILSLIVMPVTDRVAVAKGVIEAVPAAETK